jgi:type I restriction enzyme R subunit
VSRFSESTVEDAALAWLEAIGWSVAHGPDMLADERRDYGEVVLAQRLRHTLARLNPALPAEALDDAFRKITRPEGSEPIARNRAVHRLLVDGVTVEYRAADGGIRGAQAQVIDFDDPAGNDWLAVNQLTVAENKHVRRPDVVLFVNGLPLAVLELKNAATEDATVWSAFQQLQTYQADIPSLFATNAAVIASDGVEARVGTLGGGREWFKPWRTVAGESLADARLPELQVVVEGILERRRFLDLVRDFLVFEDDGSGRLAKKMAGYHQFHAVQVAVTETLRAAELRRAVEQLVARGEVARGGALAEAKTSSCSRAAWPLSVWQAATRPVERWVSAAARASFRSTSDRGVALGFTPVLMIPARIPVASMPRSASLWKRVANCSAVSRRA